MNSFVNRLFVLTLVLIGSIALVQGLYLHGRESGPAASVREQYRIFLEQKAQVEKSMRSEMDRGALKACQEI